jgi:hypothetical protein
MGLPSFFEEAERIASADYIPNEADVLRARTKTTGIYETRFTMGQLSIQYVSYHFLTCGGWLLTAMAACSMSADSGASGRSGYIASRMSRRLFSASR